MTFVSWVGPPKLIAQTFRHFLPFNLQMLRVKPGTYKGFSGNAFRLRDFIFHGEENRDRCHHRECRLSRPNILPTSHCTRYVNRDAPCPTDDPKISRHSQPCMLSTERTSAKSIRPALFSLCVANCVTSIPESLPQAGNVERRKYTELSNAT
jgi:hypothetical protein